MKDFELKDIDNKLNASEGMKSLMKALPEEQVSMAWRSSLNEKLLATVPKKRFNWNWVLRPALGLGLAGALALVIVTQPQPSGVVTVMPARGSLEAHLVAEHQDSIALYDLSGPGLSPDETEHVTSAGLTESDDVELDLTAL